MNINHNLQPSNVNDKTKESADKSRLNQFIGQWFVREISESSINFESRENADHARFPIN